MSTIVQYFVPEDKEDEEKCNAFIVYKDIEQVRIDDIRESFPIPGTYHFRFKFKLGTKNVWIDLNNPEASLPRYDNKILMKVNRLAWTSETISSNNKFSVNNEFPDFI